MTDHREIPVDNPIDQATSISTFLTGLDVCPDGIQLVRVRALLSEALGSGHRKRAGHWANRNSRAIRRLLFERGLFLYHPRAEAACRSVLESGQLRPSIDDRPDVVAMLAGDHFVVVLDGATELGAHLLDARIELPDVVDLGQPSSVIDRVQRANALDVASVGYWLLDRR